MLMKSSSNRLKIKLLKKMARRSKRLGNEFFFSAMKYLGILLKCFMIIFLVRLIRRDINYN